VVDPAFLCLPDDPATGHTDARPVRDAAELEHPAIASLLDTLVEPFIDRVATVSGFSRPPLGARRLKHRAQRAARNPALRVGETGDVHEATEWRRYPRPGESAAQGSKTYGVASPPSISASAPERAMGAVYTPSSLVPLLDSQVREQRQHHRRVTGLAGGEQDGSGRPRPSTAAWIFVLSSPRERPTA
jgi:hypothetical protein